jgi:3-oxoacyl-(acyl-carrier-protein) synthase
MRLYVNGIGLLGPGLVGWTDSSRAVLAGESPYSAIAPPEPAASLLPANERRRSSEVVRWALQVAQEAIQQARASPCAVATVFASSGGESGILNRMCTALASSERIISPTLFHHSVHNAAAGYWGIATGSRRSATALACYDASFCAGLLEAAAYILVQETPVLLVAYDLPPPPPLYPARPLHSGFAVALVLMGNPRQGSLARFELSLAQDAGKQISRIDDAGLEAVRSGNPAARALPLLIAIARGREARVCLDCLTDQQLWVEVAPCLF